MRGQLSTNLSRFAGVSEAGARRRNPERGEGSLEQQFEAADLNCAAEFML
jgi:hypothetical protein